MLSAGLSAAFLVRPLLSAQPAGGVSVTELRKIWSSLPSKALLGVCLLAWIALFHWLGNSRFSFADTPSLFGWLYPVYMSNPDDSLGLLVPFISAYLAWGQRDRLIALAKASWPPALALVAAGLLLHLLGYLVQQARLSTLGFLLGLYGLTGVFWGRDWLRATMFFFGLLLFCIPTTVLLEGITFRLRILVATLATNFCGGVLGLKLIREGTAVFSLLPSGATGFQFEVAAACSGMRSATVVLLLTLVYGWLKLRAFWRRAALFLMAPLLAVLGNVLRLIVVFIVSDAFGQNAGAAIENKFGFVTFAFAMGGVVLLGWLLRDQPGGASVDAPANLPRSA